MGTFIRKGCGLIRNIFFNKNAGLHKGLLWIVFLGILLRLKHFLENRSLWLDEAYVAVGLSIQSFSDIFSFKPVSVDLPLPPIFFLLVEKIFISSLGNNEYILRLFPFLCSIISIFLFYIFLRYYAHKKYIPIALAVFALSEPLIYYAAEVKPYSSDLMFSLLLFVSVIKIKKVQLLSKEIILLASLGCIALLFSYPSVFILATVGISLILFYGKRKDWLSVTKMVCICFFWVAESWYLYLLSIKSMVGKDSVFIKITQQTEFFLPWPMGSLPDFQSFFSLFAKAFNHPLGLSFSFFWMVVFFIGFISMFKKDREKNFLFSVPLLLALLASCLEKYPFGVRFLFFLVPVFFIFLIEGGDVLVRKAKKYKIFYFFLIILLFFQPIKNMFYFLGHSRRKEESRGVMEEFAEKYKKGDAVYMNTSAKFAFGYYHGFFNLGREDLLVGEFFDNEGIHLDREYYKEKYYIFGDTGYCLGEATEKSSQERRKEDLKWFHQNKRSWIFFSHFHEKRKKKVLSLLDQHGSQKYSFEKKGASLFLYDLSGR